MTLYLSHRYFMVESLQLQRVSIALERKINGILASVYPKSSENIIFALGLCHSISIVCDFSLAEQGLSFLGVL